VRCPCAACGVNFTTGFTAAVNELAFGANSSFGDACGRCFSIVANTDPFDSNFKGPFNSPIVVKVNNLCLGKNPVEASDPNWCGQKVSNPANQFGISMQCVLTVPIGTVVC
jgi:hypothetical protein